MPVDAYLDPTDSLKWYSPFGDTARLAISMEHGLQSPSVSDIRNWQGDWNMTSKQAIESKVLERRTKLWQMVRASSEDSQLAESLCALSAPCIRDNTGSFRLVPKSTNNRKKLSTQPPLQQVHINPFAIPSEMADKSCSGCNTLQLLSQLNTIFRTNVPLNAGLDNCLSQFIANGFDLGQVYGRLRPWWSSGHNLTHLHSRVQHWARQDDRIRDNLTKSSYRRVSSRAIPPRRVWDLYSNRVVPTYALNWKCIPTNLWGVSHSWVKDKERCKVTTNINGRQWPAQIPKGTTLDHIRIELLNLGAEYVFLDVLCLRQPGRIKDEPQRKKEWRTDIPTIGHIFRHDRYQTTIVYFNGLGKSLDLRPEVLDSRRHWFNRVWTLQETSLNWLPGGLSPAQLADSNADNARFMSQMKEAVDIAYAEKPTYATLLKAMSSRPGHDKKSPFDRVAAIAYLLPHQTRPVYDADWASPETAWSDLIAHMDPKDRTDLLVCYPDPGRTPTREGRSSSNSTNALNRSRTSLVPRGKWRPSWEQIENNIQRVPLQNTYATVEEITFKKTLSSRIDGRPSYSYGYGHLGYVIKPCFVKDRWHVVTTQFSPMPTNEISDPDIFNHSDMSIKLELETYAKIPANEPVVLVGIADFECWVVGRVIRVHKAQAGSRSGRVPGRLERQTSGKALALGVIPRQTSSTRTSSSVALELEKLTIGRIKKVEERERLQSEFEKMKMKRRLVVYRDDYFHHREPPL